jgi:hypothetical protein
MSNDENQRGEHSKESRVEKYQDLFQQWLEAWITAMVTASGVLIAVPLLILSFLATQPALRGEIAFVAVPIVCSAIAFAVNIYITTNEQHGMMDFYGELIEPRRGTGRIRWDPTKRLRRLSKLSAFSFQVGVAILVLSFVILALVLAY